MRKGLAITNCGERGHLSRDCTKPRENRKVDQAEQHYMKAKKAFKAAKVKANKASKKKLKAKTPTPPSSTSSSSDESSEDSADKETSDSSESSDSSSDDGKFGDHIAVACKQATVIHSKKAIKRASKKGIPTHKTYLEAASPSSSEDSHLSWEDYNAKTAQAGKLTRSRSWDGHMQDLGKSK